MPNPNPNPNQHRPLFPLKTRISLFFLDFVTKSSRRSDGTVNRRIFRVLESAGFKVPANNKPRHGVSSSDVTVDPDRNLWFRLFVPTDAPPAKSDPGLEPTRLPVIVFFHGGGFAYLSADFKGYDQVCRRFAREAPAVVVSVNYRLAPEHRYPAQYEDGFDVLRFLDDRTHSLPPIADVSRCFLAGDSAGANLAHHVAVRACGSKFHKLKVLGMVSIQPFFGGEERTGSEIELEGIDPIVSVGKTDWMWRAFIPPDSGMDRDHEVINVSGPKAADLAAVDFPATMVVVGGFDSLKDRQRRYYEWLRKSGKEAHLVEYPNMIHAFYIFPELPESAHLVDSVKQFIVDQCSNAGN